MLSIALALAAASVAEQLAPAKQGMAQCQMPDVLFKTCFSLSKVHQTSASTYMFETQILVDAKAPVTASMNATVFVRGSEICQVMNADDVADATFAIADRPLPAAQAAKHRAKLRRDYAAFAGRTVCTRIAPVEQGMATVIATIDGKRVPAADYAMKWVAPGDGWKVAP